MKSGISSLQEFAGELDRQNNAKKDFIAPASALAFDSNEPSGFIVDGQGVFAPSDLFEQQIASEYQYPIAFYRRNKQDYPAQHRDLINAMLFDSSKKHIIRTMDFGYGYKNARAFKSDSYRTIDNYAVAGTALETLGNLNGWTVESMNISENRMYLKVLSPLHKDVALGDTVRAGFALSNSEVGLGSVKIEFLVYRLVCSNGMIAQDFGIKRNHLGSALGSGLTGASELFSNETRQLTDRALMSQLRDVVRSTVDEAKFEIVINKLRDAKTQRIEGDPVKSVETLQAHFGLQDSERGGILNHLIAGGDLSKYGMHNAVTAYSQVVDDYDRATELERIGGKVIELNPREWHSIASAN